MDDFIVKNKTEKSFKENKINYFKLREMVAKTEKQVFWGMIIITKDLQLGRV